jgi:hypothetical protein
MKYNSNMQAVIDPINIIVVGTVPCGSFLTGPWSDFITAPVPEGADTETLGVTKDGDGAYVFCVDPAKVQAKTDQAWLDVRAQQRDLLYKSDWTCSVTDYEVPNKAGWITYRQALRDVTTQSDPFAIVWPPVPSE